MVYPEFFWIPKKLGVKNGGKSSPSENPNFLKIPEIVGVTPSFSIVGLFLFGDFNYIFLKQFKVISKLVIPGTGYTNFESTTRGRRIWIQYYS